jgi:Tol biopolymer transport system component
LRARGLPRRSKRQSVVRLELDLPLNVDLYGGNAPGVSLSPDGKRIAFVGVLAGQRHIYTRNLDSYEAVPLRGTEQSQAFSFRPTAGHSDSSPLTVF